MGSSQSSASSRNDELLGFSYVSHDVAGVPHEHRFSVDSTWGVVESRRALDGPAYDAARDRYTRAFLAAGGGREPAASQFAATRDAWRDYAGSRSASRRGDERRGDAAPARRRRASAPPPRRPDAAAAVVGTGRRGFWRRAREERARDARAAPPAERRAWAAADAATFAEAGRGDRRARARPSTTPAADAFVSGRAARARRARLEALVAAAGDRERDGPPPRDDRVGGRAVEYDSSPSPPPRPRRSLSRALSGFRRRVSSAAPPAAAAAAARPAAPESRVDRDDECVVCLDAASNVEFDCRHVVTCAGCAMKLDACPVCRAPIRTRTPVLTCA